MGPAPGDRWAGQHLAVCAMNLRLAGLKLISLIVTPPGMVFPAKPMVSTLPQTPLMLALIQGCPLPAASCQAEF